MAQGVALVEFTSLARLEAGKRILLYPAASGSEYFLRYLRRARPDLAQRIVGQADRDPHKHGLTQSGLRVYAPSELPGLDIDVVVLTSCLHSGPMQAELAPLLPGADFLLSDDIREYWDDAAQSSVLAQRALALPEPPDAPEPLSHFFLGMPLGGGAYPRSTKGILTHQFLEQIRLPKDLSGARVLELAAAEGFYGFECEARGASEILAVEGPAWLEDGGFRRFDYCRKVHGSTKVNPLASFVEDISADKQGTFDLTLCLGLYYHLKDPFWCLRRLAEMTSGTLLVTGRTVRATAFDPFHTGGPASLMMFSDKEVGKWTATTRCLMDMLALAGFERTEVLFDFCPEGSYIASTVVAAHKAGVPGWL